MSSLRAAKPLIAIVEDDMAVLHSLQFALEAQGYDVSAFDCAAMALKTARMPRADLWVIDFALPDMNGTTLLTRLRQRGVQGPAIIIASNPSARCRSEAFAAGAPLVEKPLLGDVLGDRIRAVLDAAI